MNRASMTKPEYTEKLMERESVEKAALILGVSAVSLYKYRKTGAAPATVERLAKHEMFKRTVQLPALRGEICMVRIPEEHKDVFFTFCKGMGVKVTRIKDI